MMRNKLRALIVEDDPDTRYLLELLMKVSDVKPDEASTLQQAIGKVKKSTYDYIFLDLKLADSFGIETVKKMKEATNDKIVIMTGLNDDTIKHESLCLGVHDYIYKGNIDTSYFKKLKVEKKIEPAIVLDCA